MTMKKFVCSVCGYTVEAEEAPKECPKCREMMNISWPFDEVASKKQAEDLAEKLVDHKVKRFVCSVCGYTLVAEEAPKECPQCREMMNISWPLDEVAPQKYVDELLANKAKVEKLKTFVCSVCGYTIVAEEAPKECPQCREMINISWPFDEVAPQKYVEEMKKAGKM